MVQVHPGEVDQGQGEVEEWADPREIEWEVKEQVPALEESVSAHNVEQRSPTRLVFPVLRKHAPSVEYQ